MAREPVNVLMTADAVGGVWTYALDLAEGLTRRGVCVTLAVLGPSPSEDQGATARSRGVSVIETGVPLDWLVSDPASAALAARRLSFVAGRADLVHLNSPAYAANAGFAAPVVGVCHSCVATWWDAAGAGSLPEDFKWRMALLARGYDACDALIAPTAAFGQATRRLYGVDPVIVHNGAAQPAALRGARAPVVLTSGRLWDDGKNVAALDRAAALMRGPVVAAGALDGPGGEAVRLEAIEAIGRLDHAALQHRLAQSAVFASLAVYEPFGLGVLEAAQAGCALVLSDIPTFRELWEGAAVFVDADDAAQVARTLDALLGDPDRAGALGEAASARAVRFSVDAMVDGVLAVYDRVLTARPDRRVVAA